MNSLRLRLTLAFSLVAVIPLVIALGLFGRRVQQAVEAQAAARLEAGLSSLEAQLRSDAERLSGRLELLALDPSLKRLFLLGPSSAAELRETLANQRYLLGLDYLGITDTSGRVLADGASAPGSRRRPGREALAAGAPGPASGAGPRIVRLAAGGFVLDDGAPMFYQGQSVGLVRGGIALDDTVLGRLEQTSGVSLELDAEPLLGDRSARKPERILRDGRSLLMKRVPLALGSAPAVRITGYVSTAAADQALAGLRIAAGLLGLLGVGIAIVLGFALSRQVSRPVERLATFSERISRGEWDQPLALESVRELQTLVAALERMRGDLHTYRDRIRAGERQAAYGQMARKVAHEIKNPLTPIAISVADLKRSYDQGRPDFPQILDQAVRTIGEEVATLKHLIQEFSDFGRFPAPEIAPLDLAALFADLQALYGSEVREGRLQVEVPPAAAPIAADRAQLRQALINLIQNGLDAVAAGGRVTLRARSERGALVCEVSDDGPGLTREHQGQLFVPGFTTKVHGSGLGLTIVERIVSDHHGTIAVESSPGRGTTFTIRLPVGQGA